MDNDYIKERSVIEVVDDKKCPDNVAILSR